MLMHGDCLIKLKELADNSVDSIVTDPPYGLKFMGKKWDYDVPNFDVWTEIRRVLKPGGHLLSFGGTRTYHRLAVNIEDAGFEIRDQIQWLYGSGFPKSHNLEGEHEGWGTALKPANEPIVLARKPLEKGLTVAENVLKWGCGALNIDASRIEAGNELSELNRPYKRPGDGASGFMTSKDRTFKPSQGRWPANIILDETAAAMLDEQSGKLAPRGKYKKNKITEGEFGTFSGQHNNRDNGLSYGDSGGASRFFYCAKASKSERNAGLEGMPRKPMNTYNFSEDGSFKENHTAKSGVAERQNRQNHHPTVKPIKLMEYLIRLITPPSGIVLDPFMGSGSTGVAAKNLGFGFIGIEREAEYVEIAKKRIEAAQIEPIEIDNQLEMATV